MSIGNLPPHKGIGSILYKDLPKLKVIPLWSLKIFKEFHITSLAEKEGEGCLQGHLWAEGGWGAGVTLTHEMCLEGLNEVETGSGGLWGWNWITVPLAESSGTKLFPLNEPASPLVGLWRKACFKVLIFSLLPSTSAVITKARRILHDFRKVSHLATSSGNSALLGLAKLPVSCRPKARSQSPSSSLHN